MSACYLVRVVLPDRPGSLGALATAIGAAGGDIVSLDVVERGPDGAVDDVVVELPAGAMADLVLSAALSVPGVAVESLRPYHRARDVARDLDVVDALAADPEHAVDLLARMAPAAFRAGWALVVAPPGPPGAGDADADGARTVVASAGAPELDGVPLPWLPLTTARRLGHDERWVPADWQVLGTELVAAPLADTGRAVLLGRPGGPAFRASEVVRLAHLAAITASVLRASASGAGGATAH